MVRLSVLLVAMLAVPASAGTAGSLPPSGVPLMTTRTLVAGGCLDPDATFHSALEVGEFVVSHLVRGDDRALWRMAVDSSEFSEVVWPAMPASRPELNFDLEFVWSSHDVRNRRAFEKLVAKYGGRYMELVEVAPTEVQDYGAFRIHRRPMVTVRDASGDEHRLRLFGSLIEQDGRYKLYSFRTD